ncbi:hypothetical protein ACFH34_002798, partial [Escherichia coli]
LKGLSMLSKGWPGIFAEAAQTLAFETLEHATRADHIDSDRYLIKSIYYNLFSGEDSNYFVCCLSFKPTQLLTHDN